MDDTFCIWDHGENELDLFLNELNSYDSDIQFTMEKEEQRKIPFLDVLCVRENHEIKTTVYRKPTSTFRILDAQSGHTSSNKMGTLNCLITRALRICDDEYLEEELQLLESIFLKNGYSKSTISRAMDKAKQRMRETMATTGSGDPPNDDGKEKPHLMVLPFDKNLLKLMMPIKRKCNLKIITKPTNKLRKLLVHPKDPTPKEKRCHVVYSIPFTDGKTYIGETGRPLEKRLKEHQEAVKKLDTHKSAVAEHVASTSSMPIWKETEIVCEENNWFKRRVKEAIWIERKATINRSHGLEGITKFWTSSSHQ